MSALTSFYLYYFIAKSIEDVKIGNCTSDLHNYSGPESFYFAAFAGEDLETSKI